MGVDSPKNALGALPVNGRGTQKFSHKNLPSIFHHLGELAQSFRAGVSEFFSFPSCTYSNRNLQNSGFGSGQKLLGLA